MTRRVLLRSRAAVAGLLVGAAALSGCGSSSSSAVSSSSPGAAAYDEPVLKVTGAYIPQPPTSDMAAGYFTVTNTGRQPDRLIGVTSDLAATVTMHRTTAKEQMMPVKAFTIPAGGTLQLRTGGNHLMLTGLRRKPKVGDTVTLRLLFAASDTMTVRAPVKPATYQPEN
jgi:copper(I)-binding protein